MPNDPDTITPDPDVTEPDTTVVVEPEPVVVAKPPKAKELRIPQSAFKERVDREAANLIKNKLGISLEEATAIVKAHQDGDADKAANELALKSELDAAKKAKEDADLKLVEAEKKHKKDLQKQKDKMLESEIKLLATTAGAKDTDIAMHLFAKAAAAGQTTDPKEFFETLKTEKPFLFGDGTAPPVKTVNPTTAPLESKAPGEVTPSPTPPATTQPEKMADDLSPQDFNKRLKSRYGYNSGY